MAQGRDVTTQSEQLLQKQSDTMKERWQDSEYREAVTVTSIPRFKTQAAKNWKNKAARTKMLQHLKSFSKTPKQRAANSARIQALWADPEYRTKMIAARKHSYTTERGQRAAATRKANNPNFVPWNKGLTKHDDARLMANSKALAGIIPDYNKYRAWYRGNGKSIRMRSKWEVAYAQYLDRNGIKWRYECISFYVGESDWNGARYVPDFYLVATDQYIEVKGRLDAIGRRKLLTFRMLFPNVRWKMLDGDALKALGVVDMQGRANIHQGKTRCRI